MLKIRYPDTNLNDFHIEFVSIFKLTDLIRNQYVKFRDGLDNPIIPVTLEEILYAPFQELIEYSFSLQNIHKHKKRWLKKFFCYQTFQPEIAKFFMANKDKVSLTTCYYCNIDYVNMFKDIGDFHNGIDFVKRGTYNDFNKIKGFGDRKAQKIIADRDSINSVDELSFNNTLKNNLNTIATSLEHNHFTLDHVMHKAMHPLIALSFYNFIPSCYSCNTKFKNEIPLINEPSKGFLSPTHINFNLDTCAKFKIFFHINPMEVLDITSENDFVLDFHFDQDDKDCLTFIDLFKLKGRYIFHKSEVVKLIRIKKEYDDSQIQEISLIAGKSIESIKSDLFGKELFEGNVEDKPFTKFRRDIAKDIGITNVL